MFKLSIINFKIAVLTLVIALPNFVWSAPASLPTVSIKYCYDGDTCTTLKGERLDLRVYIPELKGKKANPIPAKLARDFERFNKKKFLLEELPKIGMGVQLPDAI